jgi:hypothetical protein
MKFTFIYLEEFSLATMPRDYENNEGDAGENASFLFPAF